MTQHLRRKALLTTIAAAGLVGAAFAPAAGASGRHTAPGQVKKADAAAASAWTEDNDTNDGGTANNVADDGDNRHPSGKDRSVENGSGTQGRSTSDPDDDGRGPDRSNGGADKPDGPGGVDLADQDGNNGCGNDDDFEDDNEGWCGRKPKADDYVTGNPATTDTCPAGMTDTNGTAAGGCECPAGTTDTNGTMAGGCEKPEGAVLGTGGTTTGGAATADEGEVLSNTAVRPATVSAAAAGTAAVASGTGEQLFSVGSLAFTGANTMVLLAVALGLLALGYVLVRSSRRKAEVTR